MKVLIHDERPDIPEFLMGTILNHGYKAGLAKDGPEIMQMVSDDRYDIILTNGGYKDLSLEQRVSLKSSPVFIIGITGSQVQDQDSKTDTYLKRPFLISDLWLLIEKQFSHPFLLK